MKTLKVVYILLALLFYCTVISASESEQSFKEKAFPGAEFKDSAYKGKSYTAVYNKDKELLGYLLPAQVRGHEGKIKLLVALDSNALIIDYFLLESAATEKTKDLEKADFKQRCIGKSSAELKLTIYDSRNGKVDAVTGATMSSRAIVTALREAAVLAEVIAETTGPKKQSGTVTVTYKRSSEGKRTVNNRTFLINYRTAIWIEDSKGKLVKTLYRSVGGKIDPFPAHLVNWENKSGKLSDNTPDAVTGATVKAGKPETDYTFTWNCKDERGRLVPDGKYTYNVEVARYYQNDNNSPWRIGKDQSSLNSGVIEKGRKADSSTGKLDPKSPATLEYLKAKYEPK